MLTNTSKSVLFIHPLGYSAQKAGSDISRLANIMPPLGLASIAAYLEQFHVHNDIIDCYAHPDSDTIIREYIHRYSPPFVAFSCTTSSFYDGVRLAEMIKNENASTSIIFGGVHVSAMKEQTLSCSQVIDYVIVGEGEEPLRKLISRDYVSLDEVMGLVYRKDDGSICFTGYQKNLLNLDELPFPAYEKLIGYPAIYKLPIFNYPTTPNCSCISSRGCPYSCSYCDRSVFRKSFRYNSAEYLYNHMHYLKDTFAIRHINFYDDQFTFNKTRIQKFSEMVINKPLGMTFNCAARAEHLDWDLLKLMKKAGCWMISLGIETGDPLLLAQHRQNPDLEMMREKIVLIKKAGIRVKGLLMMGLPGETEMSIRRSQNYVYSLPIDDFNLAKFTPFPGSPVYSAIKEKGKLMGEFQEEWEKMDCMQFLFVPKGIDRERMEELFIEFYKCHYMRPHVLLGYVSMLWKSPDSWLRFVKNLPSFLSFAKTNKRM